MDGCFIDDMRARREYVLVQDVVTGVKLEAAA
jgi:hypothetical protein